MSHSHLLHLLSLLSLLSPAAASVRLGVNYGQLGDDLPSPSHSARLIRSLGAGAVKIYDTNPAILRALADTRLTIAAMVPNELVPSLAASPAAADAWLAANLLPALRRRRRPLVRFLLVGNELLSGPPNNATWPALVPAIRHLHLALRARSISNIKLGTPLAMDALAASFPPSAGRFRPDIADTILRPLLHFLNGTRTYFFIDVYPYFAWAASRAAISLDYALFEAEADAAAHYRDPGSGLVYTNLLDQQLDAVHAAMARLGYGAVRLGVAETGWPHAGDYDQAGCSLRNAATYNRNLARRAAADKGTPARPGVKMPVYVFALFDEDQKPGPGTERHWGLFHANGTEVYGLDLAGRPAAYPPLPRATNNAPYEGKIWCVAKEGAADETALQSALDYACGQGNGTCDAIKSEGECFEPDTMAAHASYAFNAYWQQFRSTGGTCFFNGLAVQTTVDPSQGSCQFTSLPVPLAEGQTNTRG